MCVLSNKQKINNKHPICCSRNRIFLVSRHNRVVNAIIEFLGRNNNLPADGKLPDVKFQKNGETWVLDVRFTKPYNEEESFASKTDKY